MGRKAARNTTGQPRTVSKNRAAVKTAFELASMFGSMFFPKSVRFEGPKPNDPAPPEPPPPTPPKPNDPPKPDPVEERFGKLEAQLKDIAIGLRQINKQVKPPKEPEEDKTLTERVKAAETREANIRRREQFNAITDALASNGIPKEQAPRFAKLIHAEEEARIVSDESDVLLPRILVKEGTDDEGKDKFTSVGDFIKGYLGTDKGAWMKPPKPTGSTEGLNRKSTENTPNLTGFNPKTKREAMLDPTRYYAWKQTPEGAAKLATLPEK